MKFLYALLVFVPIAILARVFGAPPIAVFILSAAAIVPLSGILGAATEAVAEHTSPAIGGVLSATMGNLAELIIATVALRAGLIDLVKASITGSILGNLLLVLGIALFAGGLKFKVQKFNAHLAGMSSTVLLIAVFGLVVPALFHGFIRTRSEWRRCECPTTSPHSSSPVTPPGWCFPSGPILRLLPPASGLSP